jgi:YggT family protein
MDPVISAFAFIIRTFFELYTVIVILRMVLPWVRADYYNPLSQVVLKLTEPILMPLKNIFPSVGYVDFRVLFLLFILQGVKLSGLLFLQLHILPNISGLLLWIIGDLIEQVVNLMFFIIMVVVISSWFNTHIMHPIIAVFHKIADPYLNIFRKMIPPIAGLDLSPILALITLKLISIILAYPIVDAARKLI